MAEIRSKCDVRWMIRRDVEEVLAVEHGCFACPWDEENVMEVLRQRNNIGMVAECGGRVCGYMIYSLRKESLYILKFAVGPQFQRQGIGTQMAWKLIDKLAVGRRQEIILLCPERNLAAQKFFSRMGFDATWVERNYYEDTGEDAYRFLYRLREMGEIVMPYHPTNRISKYCD